MPMEPEPEFQMVTFLEPHIAVCPPLEFPNLDIPESPRCVSDMSDSCPSSPSPLPSPSPHSSASSSESGIEDSSPPSPLNDLNQAPPKKRRKGHRRTQNDRNYALEELNKLLVKTMETGASLASTLMDHSQSPIFQSPAQISGPGDKVKSSVQTVASPTSVPHSCLQSFKESQTTTLLPTPQVSVSSQFPASPSRIKNKNTRIPIKTEPRIVIIEEPEEVFALNI